MFDMLKKPKSALVCTEVDVTAFWELMLSALERAAQQCVIRG